MAGLAKPIVRPPGDVGPVTQPRPPRPSQPPPWPQLEASPALLLPVRIETRFSDDPGQPELWVRIFPDQIAVDSFEPEVTAAEEEATHTYWERLWRAGEGDEDAELAAWRALATAYGAERAAYLAQLAALQPANAAQRPAAATPEGTPLSPAPEFAPLPPELQRPASWSRAPRGAALPDHFVVVLRRGGEEVGRAVGAPVASPLAVGPDPSAPPPEPGPGEPPVDEGLRWAVDFDAAVKAGMGLRIPIGAEDRRAGFDRILVIGMRTPATGRTPAEEVGDLLTAHRFSDGLALVPQGSPTNNTREAPSAYTRADPDFRRSFAAERGKPLPQRDGAALAAALELPAEFFAHTEHSDRRGVEDALQMLVAVWPATLGYWLRQMMGEVCGESEAQAIRDYARAWLRPRGSIPAFRVGETPYGVLPATALSRWRHIEIVRRAPVSAGLATMLRRLWPTWRDSAAGAPHMEREGDPDAALVETLGMDASARAYNVRPAVGQELLGDFGNFFGFAGFEDPTQPIGPGAEELHGLGYADWDPRLVHMALAEKPAGVKAPIVQEGPLSESEGLAPVELPDGSTGNYISWLRHATIAAIKDDDHAFPGGAPRTVLYEVLRQAVLRQYAETAWELLIDHELIDAAAAREQELIGFEHLAGAELKPLAEGAVAKRMTAWQALSQPMPESPAKETIAEAIQRISPVAIAEFPRLGELGDALDRLAELPTAELERLFTETLDSFSHRLDPWLAALVDEQRAGEQGLQLGAFGWVEDVRPGPAPRLVEEPGEEEGSPLREPHADNGGFVHAPSNAQAATGAVLRSGWMTHRQMAEGKLLAIDLSSARVRVAIELLEGVRQGQSLAALLGYRFERTLHENRLDVYVQGFRDRYPVVANKLTEPAGPAEAVAASNVVDGLALHDAWEAGSIDWAGIGAGGEDQEGIEAALRQLDDALDSLGDVSIAESVFQAVRGNYGRAGGLLDAISRGERPPEPEVVHTPRGGLDYTNRMALILTGGISRSPKWPGAGEPRALAEPRLDAWVSHFLPHPDRVKARVEYQTAGGSSHVVVSLDALALGPLDALALGPLDVAASPAEKTQESELEQLIVYHGEASLPPATVVEAVSLVFARDPAWSGDELSFPEFLAAARAARDVLGGARALRPEDLAPHEKQTGLEGNVDGTELRERAVAALKTLETRASALESAAGAAAIRAALLAASRAGVPGAVPAHARGEDAATLEALEKQAEEIAKLLKERHEKAKTEDEAFDRAAAEPQALHEHDADLIRAALGRDLPVCPLFQVPEAATVEAALAASNELLDGDAAAPARWLQQLTHVRPGVSRWDLALSTAELLGTARKGPRLAQLPAEEKDRWLALPLDPTRPAPTPGRVALAAWLAGGSDLSQPAAGLLLDEWPEQIPSAAESTGVAFHYDQPDSRAPQSLLLAVCPDDSANWEEDTLLAVVEETLELAKARAVDLETLRGIGQLVPALMLPFNVDGETVSWNATRLT